MKCFIKISCCILLVLGSIQSSFAGVSEVSIIEDSQSHSNEKLSNMIYYENSTYNGEVNDSNSPNGFGVMMWDNGDRYEGTWEDGVRSGYGKYEWFYGKVFKGKFLNNDQLEGTTTYDFSFQNQKSVFWKNRRWIGLVDESNNNENSNKRIEEINKELDDIQLKLNATENTCQELSSGEIVYIITGDVISEDDYSIVIKGDALGFGDGICKQSLIKIIKPTTNGTFFSKYSGSHVYVGEESINGRTAKVYKNETKSPELLEAEKYRMDLLSVQRSLDEELNSLTKFEYWWEKPYYLKVTEDKGIFYNSGSKYSLVVPGDVKIERGFGNLIIDVSSDYVVNIDDLKFFSEEQINAYLERFIFSGHYEELPRYVDLYNGITNAYAYYGDAQNKEYFGILLVVPEKNLIVEFSMVSKGDLEQAFGVADEMVESMVQYPYIQ